MLEYRVLFPEGGGEVCAQRYQGMLEDTELFPEGGGHIGDQRVPGVHGTMGRWSTECCFLREGDT